MLETVDENQNIDIEHVVQLLEDGKRIADGERLTDDEQLWINKLTNLSIKCNGAPILLLDKKTNQLYLYGRYVNWKLTRLNNRNFFNENFDFADESNQPARWVHLKPISKPKFAEMFRTFNENQFHVPLKMILS